jgi:hypothetical protein
MLAVLKYGIALWIDCGEPAADAIASPLAALIGG